jgi:predicted phosphodiesterase
MVRIAVLSDVHGNLPALEAVVEDLKQRSVDDVWCGGDLGWGGPWASECIALVRDAGWTTVKGNTDVWIAGEPQTVNSPEDRDALARMAEAHAIPDDAAQWLLNLPIGHNGPGSILLVHGTPQSPFQAPMPDDHPGDFAPYQDQARLVVYAHVHRAFVRRLTDGSLVCNSGSVGMASDSDAACYLLIEHDGPDVTLVHKYIPYDRDRAIARAREVGEPIGPNFLELIGANGR